MLLAAAAPLVVERVTVLSDAVDMLRFLFMPDGQFGPESEAAAKLLGPEAVPILSATTEALAAVPTWDAPAIEKALKAALVDGLKLKPRKAFAPIRVAISGRTISPPLYESMELLGRDRALARLQAATR